jgi:hypothetical protein
VLDPVLERVELVGAGDERADLARAVDADLRPNVHEHERPHELRVARREGHRVHAAHAVSDHDRPL